MRSTKIKKGSIDLDSVFSPGFVLDSNDRLVAGYKWESTIPAMNPNSLSVLVFTLPEEPHVVDNLLLVQMYVNGVKVESSLLTLNQQTPTEINYDDTDYPIISTDDVEIWYVAAT